eukprot:g2232.t1
MFCSLLLWAEGIKQDSPKLLKLLRENQFHAAATLFHKNEWPKKHEAACLYEAAKQHREDGNWGEARNCFEAAKATNALPEKSLKDKNKVYLQECQAKLVGIESGIAEAIETAGLGLLGAAFGDSEGITAYRDGKRALARGNYDSALMFFRKAKESGEMLVTMASQIDKYMETAAQQKAEVSETTVSVSVFSDNCTHILGSSTMTIGLSATTTTLGLSTKTVSASAIPPNREMVMVLDDEFPENSKKRASLILLLKKDVRKAMKLISEKTDIDIVDLARGSIIVHFCFISDSVEETAGREEEYLRQINDKASPIYKGKVTSKIDQERTNRMTMQLNASRGALTPCPYEVGDTITLAQVQDEKIECKVNAKLGEGASASVFQVTTSGKTRALKVFKAQYGLEDLCEEASLMLTANFPHSHPNVMRADFVWYEQRTNEMFFLLELVDGDDLQEWMDDERLYAGTEAEQEARLVLIVHQLACGLQHLHLRGILHEDFKPENVSMTRRGVPMLGDLGVGNEGALNEGTVQAMLRGGTPVYASPNVRKLFFQAKALPVTERKDFLRERPITHLDDFFALGATILDMFAECGWRQGRSVAEVLASNSLTELLEDKELIRVAVPKGVVEVLHACFSADESLTVDSIVELTSKLRGHSTPSTAKGMAAGRCANIRNNLGAALFDSGMLEEEQDKKKEATRYFEASHAQLEHALVAQRYDARTLNNLGVVKLTQGMVKEAKQCFENALAEDPDHAAATFNLSLAQGRKGKGATVQLDRTGAAGVVDDGRDKKDLASALSFAPGQQLEVHRHGNWERIGASKVEKATGKHLLLVNYRVRDVEMFWATKQQLLMFQQGVWRFGQVRKHFKKEFDQEAAEAERASEQASSAKAQAEQAHKHKQDSVAKAYEAAVTRHREDENRYRQRAQELESRHAILLAFSADSVFMTLLGDVKSASLRDDGIYVLQLDELGATGFVQSETCSMKLDRFNHAPALFANLAAVDRAQRAHVIELKDKHAFILDLFSGQQLDTRTQTASLRYREKLRAEQALSNDQDVDSEEYQRARKASVMQSSSHSVQATTILREMLAASGKTTLLKTFTMEIVHSYRDFVPILMPVIEVASVLEECDRNKGESVVAAFIQRKYPQHAHLLLQMMLMRRAVFLIDGIDESGTYRKAVEEFVTIELLESGHKTIITSRRSGFSSDAFKQCRLVELLPLSMDQQSEMVRARVPNDEKAERLIGELQSKAFEEIASNPLMLSMMISVYVNNGYKLISNRSELYETALRTLMGRSDKGRAGLDKASQEKLFEHLQKLASGSHQRIGEHRIFTVAQASEWASPDGWSAIEKAMAQGRLPIISSLGPNTKDEEEYRFGHMSYQEYLTGRQYYQQ